MKICFLIANISHVGGTERVCAEIANQLDTLGFEVHVLSMYGGMPFFTLKPGIDVSVLHANKPFKMRRYLSAWRLRKKLNQIKPNILILVDAALFIYAAVAGFGLDTKIIVWEHFNYRSASTALARKLSRKLAGRWSDAIVTLTHRDRDFWIHEGRSKVPVVVISNPSPFGVMETVTVRQSIVLSVGRLTEQKGFDRLLDVWHQVCVLGTTNWQLLIVGSGEMQAELEAKIVNLGIQHLARLTPATSNIEKYYQMASIYCMASRFEGFPMVLIEAQSFGLPLVSYDCETGPSEIIDPGNNGILVENGNQNAMAEALTLLIKDDSLRKKMRVSAYKNALKYQTEEIIKEWIKLFSVLSTRSTIQ